MRLKAALIRISLAAVALAASSSSLSAQAVYGSIFGTVKDPSGAPVPGVTVKITDLGRGTVYTTLTNDSGNYNQTHLVVGRYRVQIKLEGFKTFVQEPVEVKVDAATRVDATLEVGEITESVTVVAETPLLKTDRADVAVTFNDKAVTELPIFERNFTQFSLLTPGTTRLMWQHASSENPQGSIQIMVNGQHFSGTSFQLDGTDNRDPILGIIVINPTLESVVETKITSQNYDAEFGQAIAGVVTAQTRSGTNELHGSAYNFRRNDVTTARDPFTQSRPDPTTGKFIPDILWNQFGGSLGGPIKKNKTFFFGDYEGTRRKNGRSVLLNSPTAAVRAGDLSSFLLPVAPGESRTVTTTEGRVVPFQGNMIFDPLTGDPVTGRGRQVFSHQGRINVIPPNRLSPQALKLLSLIPPPTLPGDVNNYTASGFEAFDDNKFNARVDHYVSEKLHLFGRYSFAQFSKFAPGAYGRDVGGLGLSPDGFAGRANTRNQSIASGFDYTVSPKLLTDFRFGFFRYHVRVVPNGIGTRPAKDVGIPGLNLDDFWTSGMPEFVIEGTGGLRWGFALGTNRCNCPLIESEQQFQWVNNWTKISGNHTIKLGADIRYAQNLRVPSDRHRSGQLNFWVQRTQGDFGGGLGLATFLLGDVSWFSRYVSTVLDAGERQHRDFFYVQDTWRITDKLTMNYGLRWELYFPQKVTRDGAGGFLDMQTGEIRVAGIGGINRAMNVQMNYRNFAPRFGIAYQVTNKTILRMGYGRSYDIGTFGSVFGHSVTQNLPVLAIQELNPARSFQNVFTLSSGPSAPVFPEIPANGRFKLPDGVAAFVQTERMRLGTVDAWNLTLQHQLTPTIAVEAAYVANKGTHIFAGLGSDYNPNQAVIDGFPTLSTNERKPFFRGPIGATPPGFGKPFGWTQGLRYHGNDASNNYNSMQIKVEKRFAGGLQFLGHYTWSKGLNYDGNYYPWDAKLNYGPNDFDRTHAFVFSQVWELPFGRGRRFLSGASRPVDLILGGWQINSVTTWLSGFPFTPSYRDCGADRDTGPCRPHKVGDAKLDNPSRDLWFKVGMGPGTPWARPAIATFGSVSRNLLRGPGFFNTDLSILKNIYATERVRIQFRAESFNIWNVVNLANPRPCVDCNPAEDGKIFALAPGALMRQWQFGLRITF